MHCQECGTNIPLNPEMAIEDGDRDQIVSFAYNPQDHVAVKETEYYCSRACALAAWEGTVDTDETWYREDCIYGSTVAQDLYPREAIGERVREHAAEEYGDLLDRQAIDPSQLEIRWCRFADGVLTYQLTPPNMPAITHEHLPTTGPHTDEVPAPNGGEQA